jgi:hypothetical protein
MRTTAIRTHGTRVAGCLTFKRLRQEMQEVTNSADQADEKSLMKELLEVLQLPPTEAERLAEEHAAEMERQGSPPDTFTIKACACDDRSQPPATSYQLPTAKRFVSPGLISPPAVDVPITGHRKPITENRPPTTGLSHGNRGLISSPARHRNVG